MPFLGAETPVPRVLESRVGISPSLFSGGGDPGRHLGGVLPACGGRLEDLRERKPARRRPHDYEQVFVEMVPKRYTFGTGAPRKRLDFPSLGSAPRPGVLGKTLPRRGWLTIKDWGDDVPARSLPRVESQ
jgi:hypothetical protein